MNHIILVTGGSGYIASWIINYLLEGGHTVHATVRNLQRTDKIAHLLDFQTKYPDQLRLFEADLLQKGSFEKAMLHCDIVMHTASPFKIDVKNPQTELVDPALEGTSNVLEQVNQTETVQKVILTSSVAAINGDNQDLIDKGIDQLTEDHWNTSSSLQHSPYSFSKTVAEKKAWDIQKQQNRWQLVVINPSFVMGPALSGRVDGQSTQFMMDLLSGRLAVGAPALTFGFVDVRDIARAHILAMTNDAAEGRHIISENTYSMLDVATKLEAAYPGHFKLPKRTLPKWLMYLFGPFLGMSWKMVSRNIGLPLQYDHTKSVNDLGLSYRNMSDTFKDHASQLMEMNLVK